MKVGQFLLRLLPVLGVLVLWQWMATSGTVSAFLLPRPAVVFERIWSDIASATLFGSIGLSLYRALTGLAIAGALGSILGILMARSRAVHGFFDPLISIGLPMPTVAFIPIFILWFGLTDIAKIFTVAVSCLFIIQSTVYAGALGVERQLIWSARSLGAKPAEILIDIVLHAALPQIITALQIALPISLIVALVTEMFMGGGGLGGQLLLASRYADSPGVYAGILEIAATGAILLAVAKLIRARLLRWHAETANSTLTKGAL